jgi:hypothetical protein
MSPETVFTRIAAGCTQGFDPWVADTRLALLKTANPAAVRGAFDSALGRFGGSSGGAPARVLACWSALLTGLELALGDRRAPGMLEELLKMYPDRHFREKVAGETWFFGLDPAEPEWPKKRLDVLARQLDIRTQDQGCHVIFVANGGPDAGAPAWKSLMRRYLAAHADPCQGKPGPKANFEGLTVEISVRPQLEWQG